VETVPVLAGDVLELGAPAAVREGRGRVDGGVEHQVQQLGLARDVRVQRHRADAEPLGDLAHRERRQTFLAGERDRRLDDLVEVEALLRAAPGRLLDPPQQLEAAHGIATAAEFGHVS
jgi:hypothetical protein